jgi:hypothetical protein
MIRLAESSLITLLLTGFIRTLPAPDATPMRNVLPSKEVRQPKSGRTDQKKRSGCAVVP